MSRLAPYLQRRGFGFAFRIAVPPDLHAIVGVREITRSLPTSKGQAVPIALICAAHVKRLFCELRAEMASSKKEKGRHQPMDHDKLRKLMQETKHKIRLDTLTEQHEEEIIEQRRQHLRELERTRLEAENGALRSVLAGLSATIAPSPASVAPEPPASAKTAPAPMFSAVLNGFLDKYARDKSPAMYKKHKPVLGMLLEVIGDKPITDLRQADLNEFFELLGNLPPRWVDQCRKRKLTVRQLAELEHPLTLGPKTFEDTYVACVRPFLKAAKKNWQDQGFPLGLTTEGIEYLGDREEDENKQRAFKLPELQRLFEGAEMQAFAADPKLVHCFWLPHIGLFTGARVNEICQLNPQTDILKDPDSGIWHFWITVDTEADPLITKSVKNGESRKVPVHSKLLDLGFIDYANRVKAEGAKRLFPEWMPINRRASGEAEKWFRQLLRETGLRDETVKAKILGMHAFRHTLLTYGALRKPPLDLTSITGHAQNPVGATGAAKGYFDPSLLNALPDRQALLDQLDYQIEFHKPAGSHICER